jgi:hypothetical protein
MRRPALVLLGILFLFPAAATKAQTPNMANAGAVASSGAGARPSVAKAPVATKALNLPLFFEANKGQTDSRVHFMARGTSYTMLLTPTETILAAAKTHVSRASNGFSSLPTAPSISNSSRGSLIQMQLVGANSGPAMTGVEELPGKVNYLLGNDPSKWHTGVPLYSQVRTEQVYPGVDLLFHGDQKQLEYDFVVAPGADPSKIAFRIRGAARVEIDAQGDLVLHAADSEFLMHKPIIYQTIASERRTIEGGFVRKEKHEVAFQVGAYDHSQTLVIDPAIGYASFLGGNGDELSGGFAVDDSTPGSPKLYLAGLTTDTTTFSEANTVVGSGTSTTPPVIEVGFVAKIDPTAAASASLIYLTFIGGKTPFQAADTACESGFIWLSLDKTQGAAGVQPVLGGITNCSDYPTTTLIQTSTAPSNHDVASLATRLTANGNAVDQSALLGGNGQVAGSFVSVGSGGEVVIAGSTEATNLPVQNAYVSTLNNGGAGTGDCFVGRLERSDLKPTYLTYMNVGGGSNTNNESGCGAFDDSSGNILAGGNTVSPTAFTFGGVNLANGFEPNFPAGATEVTWAAKLNPSLSGVNQLVFATYFGGGGATKAANGSLDLGNGVVAIVGATSSNTAVGDIPLKNAFQSQNKSVGNGLTGYLLVLDTSQIGTGSLLCSTYFGGTGGSDIVDAVSDDAGDPTNFRIILGGRTSSTDFPTVNPIQPYVGASVGGTQSPDGFVSVLSVPLPTQTPFPAALVFSTYIGGSNPPASVTTTAPVLLEDDRITGVGVDASHTIYAIGDTNSPQGFFANTNPATTVNGFQATCASCGAMFPLDDAVIFSIATGGSATLQSIAVTPTTATIAAGQTQQFHAVGNYSDGTEKDITSLVTWTTAPAGIATMSITSPGLATGVAAGTTAVTPALGTTTVLNTGALTVTGAAPATHFSVTAPANATAGTAFSITVTALDASNATATGYTGTVHFTSSDTQAVLPANSTLTNGVGTFSVTLKTAGSQTITATDTVTASITGVSGPITVTGVGPTAMLAISKTHVGNFTQGQHSAQYTVTVSNAPNGVPTSGTVTVTDTALSALAQDFAASFSGTSNPNGVWSYGQFVESTSTFTLFPGQNAAFPTCGLPYWSGTGYPYVAANNSGSTVSCGTVTIPNDTLWMHPMNMAGTDSDVRFTAAASGTYEITGSFSALDTTTTLDSILVNGTPVFSTFICNPGNGETCGPTNTRAPFSVVKTLSAGNTVDFIVNCCSGPDQTFLFDSTGLSGAINSNLTGLSLVSMFGTGWTCGAPNPANTCTRSDALDAGASFPPITVLVNVGVNASSPQVNTVSVSGGGSATANASDSTVITPAPSAQLTITKTHTGNFTQGQQGAQYSLTVANSPGAAPTSGTLAQPGSTTVQSTGSIYDTGGGSTAPTMITLPSGATSVVFTSVTGSITTGCASTEGCIVLNNGTGNNANDPDGVGAAPATSSNTGTSSISGITGPGAGYLVGVFVPAGGPAGTAPTALDFTSSGLGTSFTSLSPQLDQVFFIGDGLTGNGTGTQQTFNIPTGAGQLWLGISDAGFYNGAPGAYGDNLGSYTVGFAVNAPSSGGVTVTETAPAGLALVSMAGTGWTCSSPNPANVCTRSDALGAGAAYPVITVTVNVAANATSPQVNTASVTGGGSAEANASDSTVIVSASTAATHFSVTAPATATPGTPINFTVTVLDASNATATGYTGNVHFTSSDGNAVLPANSTLTNGVGTFPATLNTVGNQTITATDTVTATITGTSGMVNVSTAAGATLTSIAVTPANPTEPINSSLQFTATGTFSDNSTKDITSTVAWASSNAEAATISASGLATTGGTAALTTTISATLDNVTGSTVLTVSNSPISISVTPPAGGAFPPVPPGGRLAIGIVLTSTPGFSGTVTFSCTTSSPTITCAPDPASVTLTPGGPTDVAIVLNTFCTGTTTAQVGPAPGGFGGGIALLLLSLALGGFVWTYRQSPRWAVSFAVLVLMAIGGAACSSLPKGANGATPPGNYSVTFSATVNGVTTTTAPIPFTVQ